MGLWENIKARREEKKQQEIDKEIQRIEEDNGRILNEKGIEKVTKKIEAKRD